MQEELLLQHLSVMALIPTGIFPADVSEQRSVSLVAPRRGIAIVTTDNQILSMGDVKYSFSIQSISKVFTLALAMQEQGRNHCSYFFTYESV